MCKLYTCIIHVFSTLDLGSLINYRLSGVEEAHKKNEKLSQKGVKAFFVLDESGILGIEKIEAHFEKSPEQAEEDEQSTFQSITTFCFMFLTCWTNSKDFLA